MAGDFDDVNSPEFQEAMNKARREAKKREQAKEYQPTAKEKELMLKLAQTSPKMYRDAKVGATLLLRTGDEQEKVAAQRYLDVMNQIERENPALKKTLDNPPKLSEAQQKKQDMEFLNYYAKEFPTEFKDMIKFLDFYKNSPVAQYYVGLMKEVQQNMAAPHEQEHQDNSSSGTSEPEKTDEGGNREHPDGHYDGNQGFIYISDNMEHALKMGPTVLKEYMEQGLGVEFPRDIIRHNADGGEYIPTRLLRKWFEENYLTSEQIDKINALVDDRAAFDAKVREINDRDNYVAPTPQNEQSAEQAAETEKPEAAPKGCSLKMENDSTAIWTVSGFEENADSPLKNGTYTFYKNEKGMYIQYISPDVSESPKYGPMTAEEMAEHPIVKALEKEADAATNKQYQFKYWQPMTEDEKRAYDAEKADKEYAAYISALKPEEIEKEKAELMQKAKQGDKDAEHKLAVLEQEVQQQKKAQEAQKRQEDIEKMRELLRNNPKKFEDVKNAYKAAMKDDAVKEQAAYYLGVIDEVEKDEATKEKVRQEKERAVKKLEKEIKRLEKQAKKMKEKGEKAKAEQLEAQAKEKRATLEQMRNDRAKARATDGAKAEATPQADRAAGKTQAVEQQILDARRRSGNSMA